ncbi:MAG: 30S ribosomal protein S1 [Proteobacteria bacterium]|nr:30S ribosomal protein S1 [Desulfobulbaceae bacterium]MBU4153281.1 30S ribosomal protein S1 [Pseudomonadota bacterium]
MTEELSFAQMFDESSAKPTTFEAGQKVSATVVRISKEWVFIDLGGKSEGYFALSEVVGPEGEVTIKDGDQIAAYFLGSGKGGMQFTTRLGKGSEANAHLEEAYRGGIPVEGLVEKEIKGGYDIKIAGSTRAFCPFSQIGLGRIDSEAVVGRNLAFRIIEFGEKGRNIIVSHRSILEEERRINAARLRESLTEGAVVSGTVTSIRNFGAFVDIGGIEGLLPVSEIAWGHIDDINERLRVGQHLEVVVMKLDWEKERFSFSLKNAQTDPWSMVTVNYPEGSVHLARIARLANFGAFATLGEGVDGLLHISALGRGRRINHPREVVQEGQEVEVRVDAINLDERRISLSLAATDVHEGSSPESGKEQAEDKENRQEFKHYLQEKRGAKKDSMGTLGELLAARFKK